MTALELRPAEPAGRWWDRELAEQVGRAFEGAPAEGVLEWALDRFAGRIALTCSMAEAVLVDMVARLRPGVPVIFLDTGYHFAETRGTADAVAARYPVELVRARPPAGTPEGLFRTDPDRCCALRKVAVLDAALAPYEAWISGIRRAETARRKTARVVEWDARRGKLKVNPLAAWTGADVARYIAEHEVLVNPLLAAGYDSIGCAPCTQPGAGREGRWDGRAKTECGLHL